MPGDEFLLILAGVGLAIVALYLWLSRRIPRGWHLGPKIRGKNYSRGSLDPAPGGWIHVLGEPHYVTKGCGSLKGKRLRARWRFAGVAHPVEEPRSEPVVSLYFQRDGDDWKAGERTQFYRWYSLETSRLEPGLHSMTVPLNPLFWTSVLGKRGVNAPVEFREALERADRVGLVFGWEAGRGHGVAGKGFIELLEFTIEDDH